MVNAAIDYAIRIDPNDLPLSVGEQIRKSLTIWNQDREDAIERGEYGAEDAPEWIELWKIEDRLLVLPRGFAANLVVILRSAGLDVRWIDETSAPSMDLVTIVGLARPTMKPEQDRCITELMTHRQGVLQANPGWGKTIASLEMWRRSGLRGLVLVEKGHLARQWRQRSVDHLGYEPGIIGDGEWEERELTIAMLQTLYRRLDEVDDAWWGRWGITICDEFHHAVAPTYRRVLERVRSHYFVGPTATPLEGDWRRPILEAVAGPVVSSDSGTELIPTIKPVRTSFSWVPSQAEEKKLTPTTYYQRIQKYLVEDERRNLLVASTIIRQPEKACQLVLSKRLKHLDMIKEALIKSGYPEDQVFDIRGLHRLDEREAVQARMGDGYCVVFSTIADEGFDVPRLDRLHLPWPQKASIPVKQQVGRLLRSHEQKLEPVAYDYVDQDQNVLRQQYMARLHGVYRVNDWVVEAMERGILAGRS
jgi:superfamily II DNA or RNA helicase